MELILCIILLIICLLDLSVFVVFMIKRHRQKKSIQNQIDFMAKITHDLRTPISAINGYTVLCKNSLDDPEKLSIYVDKIKKISNQMLALVNDSIDLSKAQNTKVNVKSQSVDLIECLSANIDCIESELNNKNISFIKQIQIEHSVVQTDETYLKKIILNLLSNALKYTPSGGTITLLASERKKEETESTYIFVIEDTGCGMSKEFQKHIFEPFTQEGKIENTDVASSGLGMHIVKQLVDLMRGKIEVESEQNVGTKFIVSFDFKFYLDTNKIKC